LYLKQGAAQTPIPIFENNTFAMPASGTKDAAFTLTTVYGSPVANLYANSTVGMRLLPRFHNVHRFGADADIHLCSHADATVYMSIKEGDLEESIRVPLTVTAYTEASRYTRVNTIQSGASYLIVALHEEKYLAMTSATTDYSGTLYLEDEVLTSLVQGDTIELPQDLVAGLEWVLEGDDSAFTMFNGAAGKYITLDDDSTNTYGLTLGNPGTVWEYDQETLISYTPPNGETTYTEEANLYYSGYNEAFRAHSEDSKAEIYLFQKGAVSHGEGANYLAFTSDVHGSDGNLEDWLGNGHQ
jgi:hypothetical protein